MEEETVGPEVAKLAKEKGFDDPCLLTFDEKGMMPDWDSAQHVVDYYDGDIENYIFTKNSEYGSSSNYYAAPTQAHLQKWLREKHDIQLWVQPWIGLNLISSKEWYFRLFKGQSEIKEGKLCKHHEEALERGLEFALTLI